MYAVDSVDNVQATLWTHCAEEAEAKAIDMAGSGKHYGTVPCNEYLLVSHVFDHNPIQDEWVDGCLKVFSRSQAQFQRFKESTLGSNKQINKLTLLNVSTWGVA